MSLRAPTGALGLDHIGVIVRDLDAGAASWTRLGFQLSPTSPQMGLDPATGEFRPWATANRCAVFERGYLELIGVHRADAFNPWAGFLERFEGPHILALRCAEADQTYPRLAAASDDFDPPVQRRREAPFGPPDAHGIVHGQREMRFRNIFSRDERVREGRYIVIEHQTPEVLWQPHLQVHPNRAVALDRVTLCASDDTDIRARLGALSLGDPSALDAGGLTLAGGGQIEVISPTAFAERYPGAELIGDPALVACRVRVSSLAACRDWLHSQQLPTQDREDQVWVAPADGQGCIFEFESEETRT